MVRNLLVFLAMGALCPTALAGQSLDEKLLKEAGVEPTSEALSAELTRLSRAPVDLAYVQRLLPIARIAAQRSMTELGGPLLRCYGRVREPFDQIVLARVIGVLPPVGGLAQPQVLLNTNNPAHMLLGIQILLRRRPEGAAELLFGAAQERGGWIAISATAALKEMGDRRHVPLARRGLGSADRMQRLAWWRLLEPADRPAGAVLFRGDETGPTTSAFGERAPVGEPAPPGFVVVRRAPDGLAELDKEGKVVLERQLPLELSLAYRPIRGQMLLVTPTRFWLQDDQGNIAWQCDAGSGRQNDVLPLGDGTFLAADAGSFTDQTVGGSGSLYVYDPATRRVPWRLPLNDPLTVRLAHAGTLLVAQGTGGLAWIDGNTGHAVRGVKLPAPCAAAETLPNYDTLAAAGTELVRVNPAGTIVWRYDLGGEVTSVVVLDDARYLAGVIGQGVILVEAADPGKPTTKPVLAIKEGALRVSANR